MNDLSSYAVMVGKGSGCLYKTVSQEFDYVLTAKHNITNEQVLTVTRQYIDDEGKLHNEVFKVIGEPFIHSEDNKDAAILKIENISNLGSLNRLIQTEIDNAVLNLVGYPDSRKGCDYSYRSDSLILKNVKEHGYIEAELNKPYTYNEVVGQSGGGVIKYEEGKYYIIGIQRRMAVDDKIEELSRVDIIPLSFYDEIINSNPSDLEKISISFFECFSHLKSQVMTLQGAFVEDHVKFTRNYLQGITNSIVASKLTPIYIKDFFKERLLIYNQNKKFLNHKKLWLAWLEFLIIMNIYKDGVFDDSNIEELFDTHRLIFSTTDNDWSTELQNIIKSDFRGLGKDSKIIVSTSSKPIKSIISAEYIVDIIREQAVPTSEMMIDEATEYPLQGRKLLHLTAFQKECITDKSMEYKGFSVLNEPELKAKLKIEYERLFN